MANEKQVTVIIKGCTIYNGNKTITSGDEYTCGEAEAARLVQLDTPKPPKPKGKTDKAPAAPVEAKPDGLL